MYTIGIGVPINNETGASWYEKAALLGDENAQINLGFMYMSGQGIPKDMKKLQCILKSKRQWK